MTKQSQGGFEWIIPNHELKVQVVEINWFALTERWELG